MTTFCAFYAEYAGLLQPYSDASSFRIDSDGQCGTCHYAIRVTEDMWKVTKTVTVLYEPIVTTETTFVRDPADGLWTLDRVVALPDVNMYS